MNVVLTGYFGFDNAGDEAILTAVIHLLREQDRTVSITVLSNQPDKTARQHSVTAVNRWSLRPVAGALRKADVLISGGGSLFQDQTGVKSPVYYGGTILLARLLRTKVMVYAQGIGPLTGKIGRALTAFAVNRASVVTVRDEASKALLSDLGVKKAIDVIPDPVMGHPYDDGQALPDGVPEGEYVAVSIRDWPKAVDLEERLIQMLSHPLREGRQLVFLPMHEGEDDRFSRAIMDILKEKGYGDQLYLLGGDLPTEEKIRVTAQADFVIGMRLHALIFAALTETPFLSVSYDPKIDAFAALASQPVIDHVETPLKETGSIMREMDAFSDHLGDYRNAVRAFREKAGQEAKDSLAAIRKL